MSTHYYPALRNCGSCASLAGSLQEFNSSSSLNNRTSSFSPYGEIQYTAQLVEQLAFLYLNEEFSDLVLIVDGQRFPVHRVILATRSSYFKAMLYGGMRESSEKEVTLFDTPVQAFQAVLKYIYTGKLQLKSLELSLVLDMLALVHKYGFSELEAAIPEYLKARNVCSIFTIAHLYSIEELAIACLDFIDNYASDLLSGQSFLQLPAAAFIRVFGRNSFCASELEIFFAVRNWIDAHPEESACIPSVLSQVRLSLLKMGELYGPVRDSDLFSADQILDAIKEQNTKRSSELNYRGFLFPGTNVATPLLGAKVTGGDFRSALLSNKTSEDETSSADPIDRTYAKHLINQTNSGITVSVDQVDWVRVIDHSHYVCRSRQNLLFDERVVKFIRVIGTHCSVNNTFQLSRFEAMYVTDSCAIDNSTTLQIPRLNIATIANNAIVVEGVSRSRNALLNGDTKNYDWDDGYTCHQLGSGALVVQLPQPFLVETMRLLLWDCDDRWYSFYIEVSTDQCKWAKVAEVNECRSWQTVHFLRQPVVFIRIVGTHNSANEVFHCVHFECPAMETDSASEEERVARLRRIIAHTVDEDASSATVQTSSNGIVPVEKLEFLESSQNVLGAIVEGIAAGVGDGEDVGSQQEVEERQTEGRPNNSLFGDIDQQEGSSSGRAESESSHSETVYEENRDSESMPPMESRETSN
uniref:BTB domain-containing protein n=1 Tax=Globodera pallida TaxID=36090 RepID=A0A183C5N0_GLOPA